MNKPIDQKAHSVKRPKKPKKPLERQDDWERAVEAFADEGTEDERLAILTEDR